MHSSQHVHLFKSLTTYVKHARGLLDSNHMVPSQLQTFSVCV
jgi:hypothetical protein